jgi:universal stress protein E
MLEHMLVATDLSHRAEAAIARSVELALRLRARLTLLHVVEHDQPDRYVARELKQANDALAEESYRLRNETGCEIAVRVVAGDPFEKIGNIATEEDADLIVLGRHRRRPLRDLFVGTTVERVIWRGTHPVLMVKEDPCGAYGRVGVAIDCSEPSAAALRAADSLGLLEDAQVAVVHARAPFAKTMLAAHTSPEAVRTHVDAEMEAARAEVKQFLDENDRPDLAARLYIHEGEPMTVLRAYAGQHAPDLLVMGTHGRQGISRILLGSVADEALRTLDVDILAVPSAAEG